MKQVLPAIITIIIFFIIVSYSESCEDETNAETIETKEIPKETDLISKIDTHLSNYEFILARRFLYELQKHYPNSSEIRRTDSLIYALEVEREKQVQQDLKNKLSKLKSKYDEIDGVTWYHNPYFTHYNNSNKASIYMGSDNQRAWLRLKLSYNGDDWIFFDRAILSYDGNTQEVYFNEYTDKKTEVGFGEVWEWIDVSVDERLKNYLIKFSQSSNAKMRLTGKYERTRTLSVNERKGISMIIEAHDALAEAKKSNRF